MMMGKFHRDNTGMSGRASKATSVTATSHDSIIAMIQYCCFR